jgi:hypothetical protein
VFEKRIIHNNVDVTTDFLFCGANTDGYSPRQACCRVRRSLKNQLKLESGQAGAEQSEYRRVNYLGGV